MFGALAVLLSACTIGGVPANCGTVTVPENRAEPAGAQIALNVAVLPATGARRADPVFYITGGPGGVATELAPYVARTFSAANAHRDFVLVDQRGVGGSNALRCTLDVQTTSVAAAVASCLGQTTADVTHYRTPDAMDDLDAVRQALGYDRIDVWGGSYGATAVQVYLRRHPDSVRAAVLDGPTLLDVPVFERWSSSAQRALALLDRRCRADRDCARAFPHWFARFPALLASLQRHPVRSGGVDVNAAVTAATVHELLTKPVQAVEVPFVLAQAERGRYVPLARAIAYVRGDGGDGSIPIMPTAIMCTEPWAVADPAVVALDAKGTFEAFDYPASAVRTREVCDAWPRPDTTGEDWSRVRSDVPALFLVGGADPKDPPANTVGVVQSMPNAKVVVVPGGGHGVEDAGCMPAILDRFLERGATQGLDTRCAASAFAPYPSFRLR